MSAYVEGKDSTPEEINCLIPTYDVNPLDAVDNVLIAKIALYCGTAVILSGNIASASGNVSETSPNSGAYFVTGDATIVMNRGTM